MPHINRRKKNLNKMQPLAPSKRALTWFCICFDENSTKRQRLIHLSFSIFVSVSVSCGTLASVIFTFQNISTNLEDSLYSIFQISGLSDSVYIFIVAPILRHKISAMFQSLSAIYENRKIFTIRTEFNFYKNLRLVVIQMQNKFLWNLWHD